MRSIVRCRLDLEWIFLPNSVISHRYSSLTKELTLWGSKRDTLVRWNDENIVNLRSVVLINLMKKWWMWSNLLKISFTHSSLAMSTSSSLLAFSIHINTSAHLHWCRKMPFSQLTWSRHGWIFECWWCDAQITVLELSNLFISKNIKYLRSKTLDWAR